MPLPLVHRAASRKAPAVRFRPSLEALEERVVPAFDLTLSLNPTVGVTRTVTAGTASYDATASGANLSWLDIGTDMAAGLNIVVTSGASGNEAGNITDLVANKTIS